MEARKHCEPRLGEKPESSQSGPRETGVLASAEFRTKARVPEQQNGQREGCGSQIKKKEKTTGKAPFKRTTKIIASRIGEEVS